MKKMRTKHFATGTGPGMDRNVFVKTGLLVRTAPSCTPLMMFAMGRVWLVPMAFRAFVILGTLVSDANTHALKQTIATIMVHAHRLDNVIAMPVMEAPLIAPNCARVPAHATAMMLANVTTRATMANFAN